MQSSVTWMGASDYCFDASSSQLMSLGTPNMEAAFARLVRTQLLSGNDSAAYVDVAVGLRVIRPAYVYRGGERDKTSRVAVELRIRAAHAW